MATNEFLPFAQGGTALVQTQAVYAGDAERQLGNQPGVARPEFVNKSLRQATVMAAGLGQFLANQQASNVTDSLTAAALETIIINAIKTLTAMPAGVIIWVPGTAALVNTLKLNGALLVRATYPRLLAYALASGNMAASDAAWASATGMFSPGDGSTTFRIPDLRGYSVRAYDDGRGIDAGRVIGSMQADQNQSHAHGVNDGTHVHGMNDPTHTHTVFNGATLGDASEPYNAGQGDDLTFNNNRTTGASSTGVSVQAASSNISIQAQGGSEVRVKSIALTPLIFY